MFNIGGDDKEKLEENMEEIKQLVNDGKDESGEEETDLGQEREDSVDDLEGFDQPEPDQNLQQDEGEAPKVEEMQDDLDNLQSQVQQNTEEQASEPPQEDSMGEPEIEESEPENSISTTQTRSSQPIPDERGTNDVKQLKDEIEDHINSIEEGRSNRSIEEDVEEINQERKEEREKRIEEQPLFLDVESFEDIREMVEEMHYLTTEMDDIMEHLVVGVEEDQETVKEAGQVIQEFQTRRNNIEETLKQN